MAKLQKNPTNSLLIVDGSNMAYRAYFTQNTLSHRGQHVGLIYGVPHMLRNLIQRVRPSDVIVVWDGRKSPIRKALWPDYKAKRKTKDRMDFEDFLKQRDILMKILYSLGIKQVYNIEAEADDLIYRLVRKNSKSKSITIASNDKDFLQLIHTHNVTVYQDKQSGINVINKENFKEHYNMEPEHFLPFLCITGDDSDNIPGLPGIGEVRGRKIVAEGWEDYMQESDPEEQKIVARNFYLISLKAHYKEEKIRACLSDITFFKSPKPIPNKERFLKWAYRFNIHSYVNQSFFLTFKHLHQ